jgi:hypothetical protein
MKLRNGRYKKPSLKEKVEMYENLFHEIYLCKCCSLNADRILELLSNIENWSRAQGADGPYSGEERAYYDYQYGSFWNLLKRGNK